MAKPFSWVPKVAKIIGLVIVSLFIHFVILFFLPFPYDGPTDSGWIFGIIIYDLMMLGAYKYFQEAKEKRRDFLRIFLIVSIIFLLSANLVLADFVLYSVVGQHAPGIELIFPFYTGNYEPYLRIFTVWVSPYWLLFSFSWFFAG